MTTDHEGTLGTWIESEEAAYPSGGFLRRVRAICSDGRIRTGVASIPDTAFTIPARFRIGGQYVQGYVSYDDDGAIRFTESAR